MLEYASTVWSPYFLYHIKQIEKVPCSAACFVTNNFSYHGSVTTMLEHLNWPSLEHRISFLKLDLFCKILRCLVDITITLTALTSSTCLHSHHFTIPFAKPDAYLNFFLPSTIKLLNSLYDSLVALNDINQFKDDLSLYLFP